MHDNLSFKGEKIKLEEDKSLSGLTFFTSRGRARYFARPETIRELREVLKTAQEKNLDIKVIGSGTHVILPDGGFDGMLISTESLKGMTIKGSLITAMAGESLENDLCPERKLIIRRLIAKKHGSIMEYALREYLTLIIEHAYLRGC